MRKLLLCLLIPLVSIGASCSIPWNGEDEDPSDEIGDFLDEVDEILDEFREFLND